MITDFDIQPLCNWLKHISKYSSMISSLWLVFEGSSKSAEVVTWLRLKESALSGTADIRYRGDLLMAHRVQNLCKIAASCRDKDMGWNDITSLVEQCNTLANFPMFDDFEDVQHDMDDGSSYMNESMDMHHEFCPHRYRFGSRYCRCLEEDYDSLVVCEEDDCTCGLSSEGGCPCGGGCY